MYKFQFRGPKPSFQSAVQYHKQGYSYYGAEGRLEGNERRAELQKICEDLDTIVMREFPRTQNLEYAILKAHLILEHVLVQYIRSFAYTAVESQDVRFPFSQKLEVAHLLGFGRFDPISYVTVERLNKIRNQVAHTFSMDKKGFDEMLRINAEDYDSFVVSTDRERITYLRSITRGICAFTVGLIVGAHTVLEGEAADDASSRSSHGRGGADISKECQSAGGNQKPIFP
ncbi:hypothetical protein [Sinorhizobium meliloti]|uniref:hypothetical protein n=1 Tax=Rhizobium meliloti TaxID=382 RepID=UPI000FD4DF57|nr:hypothetical protein [Sinorhizobium meliloti]RVR06867.1 hypothetical protein CN243_22905 [Sinorhizobium meliloti]